MVNMVTAHTDPMKAGPASPKMDLKGMITSGAAGHNAAAKKYAAGSTMAQSRSGKPPNVKAARKAGQMNALKGL